MTETPTALATKMGSIIGHRIDYNAGAYAGGVHWVHVHPPPHLGKKFHSETEISKREEKVPPRYVGKKECARSAQIRQN